jgi:hypothetical protein
LLDAFHDFGRGRAVARGRLRWRLLGFAFDQNQGTLLSLAGGRRAVRFGSMTRATSARDQQQTDERYVLHGVCSKLKT